MLGVIPISIMSAPMIFLSRLAVLERHRYIIILALFFVLVTAKLHGSSLPMWDRLLQEKTDPAARSLLLGAVRPIRSDEWLVQTPQYLAQTVNTSFFPRVNPSIRSDGQNMLISLYAPVFDITLLGKPFNWGFVLLGKEYGLSWYWWSKLLLLFLLSYETALLLTDRDRVLSLVGAIWITFSSAVQWWFSTSLVDLMVYAQAIVVTVHYYTKGAGTVKKALLAGAFTSAALGFVLTLYPPFQIPLGYLTLLLAGFAGYRNRTALIWGRYDYALLSGAALLLGVAVIWFVSHSLDAMRLITGTVYPGQRFTPGGGYDLTFLQFYLVGWMLPYKDAFFPGGYNVCELSSFVHFLPVILLVFLRVYHLDGQRKTFGFALFCYLLFLISWLFLIYPAWFAKLSFFSRVPGNRLRVIAELTAVYLSLWVFSLLSKYRPLQVAEAVVVSLTASVFYYSSLQHSPMYDYLGPLRVPLILLFLFLLNSSFLLGQRKSFAVLLIVYVLAAGLTVNPLSRGVSPLYEKVTAQKVLEIERQDPGQKWAGLNNLFLGNLLVALGVKSLNSVHYYPDLALWKSLDPAGTYWEVYNRYAHVVVRLSTDKTSFQLDQPDVFTLFITMKDLRRTGVRYLLSQGEITAAGLQERAWSAEDNMYIYAVAP